MDNLNEQCPICDGDGQYQTEESYLNDWEMCRKCNGEGRVLTPAGRQMLSFMREHAREIVRASGLVDEQIGGGIQ